MIEKLELDDTVILGRTLLDWIELICDSESALHTVVPLNLRRFLYIILDRHAAAMLSQLTPDKSD